jgi:hypothetical protein
MAGVTISDDWQPTAEAINALPQGLRDYIHHLATHSDPQFTIQENFLLREQVRQLEAMLLAARVEASDTPPAPAP